MTQIFKLSGAALVLVIVSSQPALAGSLRCGTHIISSGQGNSPGQYEVLKWPDSIWVLIFVYSDEPVLQVHKLIN